MKSESIILAVVAIAGYTASSGKLMAADEPAQLNASAPISHDVAAFPRLLAAPGDKAALAINLALAALDNEERGLLKDCIANAKEANAKAEWSRSIAVTMRGPRYLSFLASDQDDCGGPYPDSGYSVVVYDLRTGAPVDWSRLLPQSREFLWKMFTFDPKRHPVDPDCSDTLQDPELKFNLWPDAKEGGIAISPADLPHVVQACADIVVVPTAVLRKMGGQADILDAIDTAHARGWYDPRN